jgi:hypothetical protein
MNPLSPVREDFATTAALAVDFLTARGQGDVGAQSSAAAIDAWLAAYGFDKPRSASDVASDMFDLLGTHGVRSDHPRYFGLFNPPALPAAILGDLIAATINPQLDPPQRRAGQRGGSRELRKRLDFIGQPARLPGAAGMYHQLRNDRTGRRRVAGSARCGTGAAAHRGSEGRTMILEAGSVKASRAYTIRRVREADLNELVELLAARKCDSRYPPRSAWVRHADEKKRLRRVQVHVKPVHAAVRLRAKASALCR